MIKHFAVLVACLFMLAFGGTVAALEIGNKAPDFHVFSGDGKEMSLARLAGKTVVLLYETRYSKEQNRLFKREMMKSYRAEPARYADVRVLPVVNCKAAFSLVRGIWKKKLMEHSRKEGILIFGDWDGKLADSYSMKPDASNIIVIDKDGFVRFVSCYPLDSAAVEKVLAIIRNGK